MQNVKPDAKARVSGSRDLARHVDEAAAAGRPITLVIDDQEPVVIQDEAGYRKLWELVDALETEAAVREALAEVERGETIPLDELDRRMRARHGLPD